MIEDFLIETGRKLEIFQQILRTVGSQNQQNMSEEEMDKENCVPNKNSSNEGIFEEEEMKNLEEGNKVLKKKHCSKLKRITI